VAAITQIHRRHSDGRAYYDKKLAEGKTSKQTLRSLKRQVSNAIFACLQADARRAAARAKGPGGQQGNDSASSAASSHPRHRLFGQATPGPDHHPTAAPGDPPPGPAHGRAGLAIPDRCHTAASDAEGPGGTPAVKRGRTTWRRGETTAILGREEGQGARFPGKDTAPEGHLTRRERDRRNLLTKRLSICAST